MGDKKRRDHSFGAEAKDLLLQAQKRFEMAREKVTEAFNNEALDTLHRITAIRYRVMAAILESVAKSLAATSNLQFYIEKDFTAEMLSVFPSLPRLLFLFRFPSRIPDSSVSIRP